MPDPTKKTISATEMAGLLGVSPYLTKWMLYQKFAKGIEPANPAHNRMDWGLKLEPLILEQAAEDLHLEVRTNRQPDGSQIYMRRGLLGCSRDADIYDPQAGPGACEAKACFDYRTLMQEWDGGKTPPRHVEIQLQVQLYVGDGVTPYGWGTVPLWCGAEMTYFHRKPMPDLWAKFEEEAKAFFDDVAAGREPEPFGSPVEMPLLKQIFDKPSGEIIKAIDIMSELEATRLAQRVVDADYQRVQRLAAEKVEENCKAELLAILKDADEIELPQGIRVTRQVQTRNNKAKLASITTAIVVKAHIPQQMDGTFNG